MTKKDLALLAAILAGAALLLLFLRVSGQEGDVAVLSVNGEEIGRFWLDQDQEYLYQDEAGNENLLVIEDHTICVKEANCPDGLCIRQGAAGRSGESIICLPHRLVITIEGEADSAVDAVVK